MTPPRLQVAFQWGVRGDFVIGRSTRLQAFAWVQACAAGCLSGGLLAGLAWAGGTVSGGVAVLVLATAAWAAAEAAAALPDPAPSSPDGRLAHGLAALTGLCLLGMVGLPLLLGVPSSSSWRLWLGGLALLGGAGLRLWAILSLGARFNSDNSLAIGAGLTVSGPYRLFAHPSEVGLLLIAAGGLALVGRPLDWLWFAPLYGLQATRLLLEERALWARHGETYRRYRAARRDPLPSFILIPAEPRP